ncbi:NAD(P)H-hydrate epimerase [Actinomortierella wolfii]|nr:NAD(P)H-hydrate epimerase [Actinomortierella wolfii]
MSIKYLGQKAAQAIDVELMSPGGGGFAFEQLVELAGFSVAQAITKVYSKDRYPRVLVCSGPGNNGLDGLVAARHLSMFGYEPKVYYPKRPDKPHNKALVKQCQNLCIPFVETAEEGLKEADVVVDAIFGFSFTGEVRPPFGQVIEALKKTKLPIVSVDIPSAWDVEKGNINDSFHPEMLVSLTAPKEGARDFRGPHHFLGGRFISKNFDKKWGLNLPEYPGTDHCVRLEVPKASPPKDIAEKMDQHFLRNVVSESVL